MFLFHREDKGTESHRAESQTGDYPLARKVQAAEQESRKQEKTSERKNTSRCRVGVAGKGLKACAHASFMYSALDKSSFTPTYSGMYIKTLSS